MRIDKPNADTLESLYAHLEARACRCGEPTVKYIELGTRTVRLLVYSSAFMPFIERHLAWSLKDEAGQYCATLVVWQEDISDITLGLLSHLAPDRYRKLRIEKLTRTGIPEIPRITIYDEDEQRIWPLLETMPKHGTISANNPQSNTYYYALQDLAPEEVIKRGHLFVHAFSKIANTPSSNLVHGAAVGVQDTGVLFCGIGYRGKSTLTVNALLDGFDYVSDDYLVVENQDSELRAWPIYSMVALSSEMYHKQYENFRGKFLSNNARKDKYIFNIEAYHEQFRSGYPIKLCMYLRIANCAEPSIVPGDKEIAIEELTLSSLRITGNAQDVMSIGKLYGLVQHFPFYRFNLSTDLGKNTRCLREFLENYEQTKQPVCINSF